MMERQDLTLEGQTREERAIMQALALLNSGETPDPADEDHELVAEYLKTWTSLPLLLEPATPRPETKDALLRSLSESSAEPSAENPSVIPFHKPQPERSSTPGSGPSMGYWALAATLAAAVLGLGIFSMTLSQKVVDLGQKVQQQESSLASLLIPAPLGHMEAELTPADFTYKNLPEPTFGTVAVSRSLFFQVEAGSRAVGKEEGPEGDSLQGENPGGGHVDGGMLVCAKHRRWLLHLQGLEPLQGDQQYHLWFLTDEGPVHVGPMETAADHTAHASADRLPGNVRGLLVSQENSETLGAQPTGPVRARASRPVTI